MILGLCLFVMAYALIVGPRLRWLPLDRPAGAMVGAVAFVVCGVESPAQALGAVNLDTLVLLFGLMGVGAVLAAVGLLDRVSDAALRRCHTPQALLAALVWGAGGLSAVITNDAVCVLGAPIVVRWIERRQLPAFPFLLALATASNTGSVATLVGNPQNMLCASLGGLDYRTYLLHMLPVALGGLALNHVAIAWLFRRELRSPLAAAGAALTSAARPRSRKDGRLGNVAPGLVLLGSVAAYLAGAPLPFTAVAGFTVLLVTVRAAPHEIWPRIDWTVLVFFAALFVIVDGFVRSGGAGVLLSALPLSVHGDSFRDVVRNAAVFLLGSNVVSNVPFILVVEPELQRFSQPLLGWELLAMASTFAGNMTLLGSVANIIVAERGAAHGGLPFWRYLRVGLPLALLSTAFGAAWLFWVVG